MLSSLIWEFSLMRITYPSILFLALTLAACGGGSSGAATQASNSNGTTQGGGPATDRPKSTGGLIEYYGDSTIWGWKTNSTNSSTGDRVAVPAPEAFRLALPTTPKYEVKNEGANGSTACSLLRGEDGVHNLPWDKQMSGSTAKWVIVNHGINDRKTDSLDTYKSCLRQLAKTAKDTGKEIIFETPNPISAAPPVDNYAQAMREVANESGAPVIDQFKQLTEYMQAQGLKPSDITPDGLHPTDEIYIRKGEFAAKEFTRVYP
jgi:lysophospholipase L1-like esterase